MRHSNGGTMMTVWYLIHDGLITAIAYSRREADSLKKVHGGDVLRTIGPAAAIERMHERAVEFAKRASDADPDWPEARDTSGWPRKRSPAERMLDEADELVERRRDADRKRIDAIFAKTP